MPTNLAGEAWAGVVAARLMWIVGLVALSALFAAAEAALSVPVDEADGRAMPTTAARIGSSVAAVGLGAVGGSTWFVLAVLLHIVVGELVPRAVARAHPDLARRYAVPVVRVIGRILTPFVIVVNAVASLVARVFRVGAVVENEVPAHSPGELRTLVMHAHAHGELDESERAMLAGVFDFKQKRALDVMRPRTEVVAIDIECTHDEVVRTLRTERYSRYPLYRETLDDIVGVFLAKDLWLREAGSPFVLAELMREALYVPDSRAAERVLDDLRRTRAYMAIVIDEYGGTAGIITIEDLVEEVMGDITDEYDMASRTSLEMNGVLELAGTLSLLDARSEYHLDIPEGDWSTLGGFVFSRLGRLPRVGDRVRIRNAGLEVVAMDGRRVAALRVLREPGAAGDGVHRSA
ncbi:MAG: hemolysin family protein [Gemmatimonadota bacterium]|nr:hemolysin family protein [Gemmatimonadota bacterium]